MSTFEVIEKLKIFLGNQVNNLAINNPLISFSKPLIIRMINNNMYKAQGFLSMLADEKGDIDTKTLIPEMIQSVMSTQPFTYNTIFLGDLEIGGGCIKLNIPLTNNQLVLSKPDFDMLKDLFNCN